MKAVKNSLELTKACVNRDICEANIYHSLMFKWINGLVAIERFNREFEGLFHYVRDAFETKYILALAKIFARSNEAGLWRLILQVKDVSEQAIEIKLEREHAFIRNRLKRQREEFLVRFEEYENQIKEISDKISPYRNVQRVHNIPWWQPDSDATWNETKAWLTFAESVFVQVMDGICEGHSSVGGFYPSELNGQIEYFAHLLEKGLANAEQKKNELRRTASGLAEGIRSAG